MISITGKEFAALLFGIHEHDEKTEKIIYYEEDILPILEFLGLPKPEWGESITLEKFKKKHKK